MDDSPEANEQQYRTALLDLEIAVSNFRTGCALGLLSIKDMEALNDLVEEKTKALGKASALLMMQSLQNKSQ